MMLISKLAFLHTFPGSQTGLESHIVGETGKQNKSKIDEIELSDTNYIP